MVCGSPRMVIVREKIVNAQRFDRLEKDLPANFPIVHQRSSSVLVKRLELAIAKTVRLFSVSRKKVTPTRVQVSGYMFDDSCDRVCLSIDERKKLFVADQINSPLSHLFVVAK